MLEHIFHQATTFEDHLVLYNREITRQQAILQARSFTEYVLYFQVAHRLKKKIGKTIPYAIDNVSEELLLEKSKTIQLSINDYYIENITSVVQYIQNSKHLLSQNPWPHNSFMMHFTAPTMDNETRNTKQGNLNIILLKLIENNLVSIDVQDELKGIYKQLLIHSINHLHQSEKNRTC